MLLIGVTGSIGMGKSTVAKMFTEYGYGLYNADDTVHYIYENDEEVINKIEESFPGTKSEGKVNRIALRDMLNKNLRSLEILKKLFIQLPDGIKLYTLRN